ncbi:MAG: hypothetical protein GY799_26715 [Desulfobulbaceae bacterium]|nr:hypothetical protein [Desulfobulbaceae bacterium]
MTTIVNSLQSEFQALMHKRSTINTQFEDYAGWTLPYLFMPEGSDEDLEAQHDFQSVGAQAVNHLANRIAKTLFPAGRPFFRMDLTDSQLEELITEGLQEEKIENLMSKAEKEAMKKMSTAKMRTAILAAIKHLIVFGNALMYFPKQTAVSRPVQVYNPRDYVIQRDMAGRPTTMIMRDNHQLVTLPEAIQDLVVASDGYDNKDPTRTVELYTVARKLFDGRWQVYQEVENQIEIPGTRGLFTDEDLPWIPLTWNLQRGANYGNGLVEEYAGDFHTLSSLSEALLVLSGLVSDIKILVDPMGSTDVDTLNDSESGTYVHGNADDISFLQLEKFQDMKFLREQMNDYERRLGAGFLLNTAVTRDAERVTAEEIRMQANELEGSFGGVYSRLAEEMQQPIAKRIMIDLDPGFKGIEPLIITGVESLSRTSELDEMMLFFNDLAMLANLPERAAERLNFSAVISKLGAARAIDYDDLLLTEEQVEENRAKQLAAEQQSAVTGEQAKQAAAPPQPI